MAAFDLSVVIPTYNEEERLPATLATVAAYLRDRGLRGEILLADDGSTDGTLERAADADLGDLPLRILAAPVNRGKGNAVRRGMLAARGEVVLFTDADLSTPIEEMDRFLTELHGGHAVVIASRKLEPGRVRRRQPWPRQFMGRVFSWLARGLLHPGVADFTCGFKAFRQDVVRPLFEPMTLSGWAFDAELLHLAHRRGIPVRELPVAWSNRRDTRVRLGRDVLLSALGLAAVLWNGWRGRYGPPPST